MEKPPPDMKVRLSADLRQKITKAANENNRTLNSEIAFRLENSFRDGSAQVDRADQASELDVVRAQVQALENRLKGLPTNLVERLNQLDEVMRELDNKVIIAVEKGD